MCPVSIYKHHTKPGMYVNAKQTDIQRSSNSFAACIYRLFEFPIVRELYG